MRGRGRTAPFEIAAMLVLLSLALIYFFGPGFHFTPEDAKEQAQLAENRPSPWKREGNDMGMVLLDIPTRQAALAFHVPRPGVYVLAVVKDSPADLAGAKPGDHIAGVGSADVSGAEELTDAFDSLKEGETLELTVLRGMEWLTITLKAGAEMRL